MTFMTPENRRALSSLTRIAGHPLFVERAFAELTRQHGRRPTLEEVLRYILDHRADWRREMKQASEGDKKSRPAGNLIEA